MAEKNKDKLKFLILVSVFVFLMFSGRYFHIRPDNLEQLFNSGSFFLSAVIFVFLYVLVTFFIWFSKDAFRVAAAVLFGAYRSTLLVFIAEIINAVVLFFLSRYLGRGFVEKKAGAKDGGLDKKLSQISFFWLVMFRLTPVIPFRFMDMAAGLTKISFRKYLSAVILGSPLRIFWLQFVFAGVGKSILLEPQSLIITISNYLLLNNWIFAFSFIYFMLVVLTAYKLRKN